MQREACVIVNGMSLMGGKGHIKKQNKQKNTKKSLLPYSTTLPQQSLVYVIIRGINLLVARMPISGPGLKKRKEKQPQ